MLPENAHSSVANDDEALPIDPAASGGVATAQMPRPRKASDAIKRVLDLVIVIPASVFLAPALLAVAFLIQRDDSGPILFRHERRGKDGKPFLCYKFRTMVLDAPERLEHLLASDPELRREWDENQKLKDDPRITRCGGLLRRTSLDELPQLWNILRGEMSIVGPRPIVEDEVRRYGSDIEHYDAVKPGVLGLWQVKGRSDTTYEERVALDVDYAMRRSVFMDLSILIQSIPAILLKRGAY